MSNQFFIEKFYLAVENFSKETAIYFGDETYSYEKVNSLSNNIANEISKLGFNKETIIPLVLERTPDIIIAMIGILKAGCAFLPISPSSPCSRIEYILDETKANMFFCDKPIKFNLSDNIKIIAPNSLYSNENIHPKIQSSSYDLAYVMYTSGSTGKPKGVLIEHQSMMNLFNSLIETLSLSSKDLFIALTDYTFDISLIELLMPLCLGAGIVLTEHGVVADGNKIKQYLTNFNINFIQATPLTWEILLKNGWRNDGVIRMLVGGENFKTSLALRLNYEKGNVWNVYGPTETSMWSMIYHLKSPIESESVPLGKPVLNTTIKLIDEDTTNSNNTAELQIGGLGVARGYLNANDLTNDKFIYDTQAKARFYKTGDLVTKIDNNIICYAGRKDNQLKFGGIRIEAGEIETTIEQEVFVKKAVVKIHEHNNSYKTLAAYVEIDEEALFFHGSQIISEDSSYYMRKIYDEVYSNAKEFENNVINTCGWQSSFTGENFSTEELSESYTNIRRYIKNANLDCVLEVGCGTGSLLLEYLPHAKKVTLVEISKTAIDYIQSIIPKKYLSKVKLKQESIINTDEISKYSCIIINSVIQYLPSIKSLIDSIRQLIKATKQGGTIFIGDVRSLELFDTFLTIKFFFHHADKTDICPSNLFYKSRDTEIVLSPRFFYALKEQFKEISWVDFNVKHGLYPNELNYFRYDVVLHINKPVRQVECRSLAFNEFKSISDVIDITSNYSPKPIKIQNIPYDYIDRILHQLKDVGRNNFDNLLTSVFSSLDKEKKSIAHSLLQNKFHGYDSFIQYQNNSPQNYLQMILVPISGSSELIRPLEKEKIDSIHAHCREPFSPWLQKFCFEHIKINVRKHVMAWVNPSIYIWVEKWPQTINGKLDKKKLYLPITPDDKSGKGSVLSKLKQMWLNITGDNALISEEFWTHGISSLSMYYFLATINETFHIHMTYHEFHQYNTMEKLSVYIKMLLDSSNSHEHTDKDMS